MKRISLFTFSPLRRIALVVALHNAWFWVPIWVLYYRRFTTYSGVAALEAFSMGVSMVMIIPGGILSDWIGRTRLLIGASIFAAIGAFGAGFSPSFFYLVPSILCLSIAGGLYQASIHALLYDTLKSVHREREYERILGKCTTVQMMSAALASAVGGFLYGIDPRFPWFAVSILTGISAFIAAGIQEPRVETTHDSFTQFIKEAGRGVSLLLKKEWRFALPLILVGIFLTTDSSGLWDIQAVEFGFTSTQLGFLLTLTYLALAGTSLFVPRLLQKIREKNVILFSGLLFSLFWLFSSEASGIVGAVLLVVRSVSSVTFDLKASVIWNRMIPSSIRATTLSAIAIIRGLPYIAVSWGMGIVLDTLGVRPLVRVFSFVLLSVCFGAWLLWRKKDAEKTGNLKENITV